MLAAAGCGEDSAGSLIAKLDEKFGCVEVRDSGDDTKACHLGDKRVIAVQEQKDGQVIRRALALHADGGNKGPWIVGEGWYVVLFPSSQEFAFEVQRSIGGEIIHHPAHVPD